MTLQEAIQARNISNVVHFTTNLGVLGVLASRSLKARARLNDDEQLRHIFQPNAIARTKDVAWLDYVNLSISRINKKFFDTSSKSWHREKNFWWCILSFDPVILEHPNVMFTNTNNVYTGIKRAGGVEGFEAMFAPRVVQWSTSIVNRPEELAASMPTCYQAEVLYPGEVSTDYLRKIYVETNEVADELAGQISAVGHNHCDIVVDSNMFSGIR